MALRAFKYNPSLGGFGTETQTSYLSHNNNNINNDAFPQIIKELVDNAVDACSVQLPFGDVDTNASCHNDGVYKRVRVKIEAEEFTTSILNDDNNQQQQQSKVATTLDCLRVTVSDNGVGMENIDDCVMVFSSNKNGSSQIAAVANNDNVDNVDKAKQKKGRADDDYATNKRSKLKNKKKQSNKTTNDETTKATTNDNNSGGDGYTSGRYGLGLTLCLLHAQHLVPGSVTCITSTTANSKHWSRNTYQVDMDADNVRCKKRETLMKENEDECGTIVSLLVPGGANAQQSWPRLAEYFARYQLSLDLPCSLEVLAPSLCKRPLMVRPPSEMERRIRLMEEINDDASDDEDEIDDTEWGDGCDDENDDLEVEAPPHVSKAVREREREKEAKDKKISMLCKAAEMYKGRPVSRSNVVFETHPIRRHGENAAPSTKNSSSLEVSIVVFGPEPECNDSDDESAHHEYPQSQTIGERSKKSASLQLVRMVNGIPLLDSPEAVACGLVQKISNNASNWNAFGLDVSLKKLGESDNSGDDNTPMFGVEDSAQVAPFFSESAHGLFHGKSDETQSSDDDTFDPENLTRKRKKEKSALKSLLPAALRLGEMMMIVQIRAKPSALPLPTLSKGRLPMNDKGINDALENGITSCLRSLQRSNPSLLLTAHQLKRVERDSKYVPAVAGAIASVLCHSKQVGLYANAVNVMSDWDEEVKKLGISPFDEAIDSKQQSNIRIVKQTMNANNSYHEREMCRVDILRPLLERRLRFIVSEEFKDSKKEKVRKEREDEVAARRKRTLQSRKQKRAAEEDDMEDDYFENDDSPKRHNVPPPPLNDHMPIYSDFESETSSPEKRRPKNLDASDEASKILDRHKQKSLALVPQVIRSPSNIAYNDGFSSNDEEVDRATNKPGGNVPKTNDMWSDNDDWSEEYGMVVPGKFFR